MKVELIDYTPYGERKIVQIAKLSHGKSIYEIPSNSEIKIFIDKLLSWKHFSVFEHSYATFYFTECSLNCTHQLVRHRHFSFLQKSRRYTNDEPEFIIPDTIENSQKNIFKYFLNAIDKYNELIEQGIPPEDARFVLPTGLETEIIVTGNFREWMHFLNLRIHKSAQWEIRNIARKVLQKLNQIAPYIFNEDNLEKFE